MIYNWTELSLDAFEEIFNEYWNGTKGTEDKVLEIQNITSIACGFYDIRVFFGAGIKLEDWKEQNKDLYTKLEGYRNINPELMKEICKDSKISLCITQGNTPMITPVGACKEHYPSIMSTCFGDTNYRDKMTEGMMKTTTLWFYKDEDEDYSCDIRPTSDVPREKRMIRFRAMNLEDWKKEITNFTKTSSFTKEFTKDDIRNSKVRLRGSMFSF